MGEMMNSKILKALIEAGAIKKMAIIGEGSFFRVEVSTPGGTNTIETLDGKLKTWNSLDSAARWVRQHGIGQCDINISRWQPDQKGMRL
jgi:hypothetical protein